MLAYFRKLLRTPNFEDRTLANQAQSLSAILRFMFVLTLLFLVYAIFFPLPGQVTIALVALVVEVGLWLLMQSGRVRLAGILFTTMIWIAIVVEEFIYGGIRDAGFASFAIVIVTASLTIGFAGGAIFTALSIIAGIAMIVAENSRFLVPRTSPAVSVLASHSVTFFAILLLLYLATRSIIASTQKIAEEQEITNETNKELKQSHAELKERTMMLERRNSALETVTEIGHLFNRVQNENEFLSRVIELLSKRLGYDSINIFLVDQASENILLRASSREMPVKMLQTTRSEIAYGFQDNDTLTYQIGGATYNITAPQLAKDMLSSYSLPIESGGKLLGLLNIQSSTERNPADDASVFDIIADQISSAIENIRSVDQLQQRLREIDELAGETIQAGWKKVEAGVPIKFEYDRIQVLPGGEEYPPEIVKQLIEKKSVTYVTQGPRRTSRLVAPIVLRNQVLGMIGYEEDDPGHIWEQDSVIVLETVASQVSLALENTRLIAEAQERAQQEKLITNVTARMRETLDVDIILQTAIREMREAFALKEAEIRLQASSGESVKE